MCTCSDLLVIAQMVERRTVEVKKISVGRVFESLSRDYYIFSIGDVAQMVEHPLSMREVEGSMPFVSTSRWQSGLMRQT